MPEELRHLPDRRPRGAEERVGETKTSETAVVTTTKKEDAPTIHEAFVETGM
ncbi:MAG: hypothetical protein J5636_07550 [Clostridiales bacterium]|nr:hypothetical protein [Clostridiales bacterium]